MHHVAAFIHVAMEPLAAAATTQHAAGGTSTIELAALGIDLTWATGESDASLGALLRLLAFALRLRLGGPLLLELFANPFRGGRLGLPFLLLGALAGRRRKRNRTRWGR